MVTSFNILGKPIFGLVFLAFLSQNPVLIGITIVSYFAIYFLFRTNKELVYDYIETAAMKNTADTTDLKTEKA